jgi:aminopeptidase N
VRIFYSLLVLLLLTSNARSQQATSCAKFKNSQGTRQWTKVTRTNPLLDAYDAQHLKLDLNMTNVSTQLSGSATTTAQVIASSGMSKYAFELSEILSIDSAFLNGVRLPVSRLDTDFFAITPASVIPYGQRFVVKIFYHGTAPTGGGSMDHGLNQAMAFTGTRVMYSLSEPYFAKEWWPCKQSLDDKLDSADLCFNIPAGLKAGSNGLLQSVTPLPSGLMRYEWKTKYPIDYYLISVAIAPFVSYEKMMHFSGSNDSMLVLNYVYDTAQNYANLKPALDSTFGMLDYFSGLFGRYPFWQEKYGHCITPYAGGMEHQTMSTVSIASDPALLAHELAHQWWGDCVTFASWRDIWLAEGFATYAAALYAEHCFGSVFAQTYRNSLFNNVIALGDGSVYVDDTLSSNRVFDSRLSYYKGAAVAHMLRLYAPDSVTYFKGLQDFQSKYSFKAATTADFQHVMEVNLGRNLDTFFAQWIYGEGFPIFATSWNQKGNNVYLKFNQWTSDPASVSCFSTPLQVKLLSAAGDTVISLYINQPSQYFTCQWNKPISDVVIDPYENILDGSVAPVHDRTLSADGSQKPTLAIVPNPASYQWQLRNVPVGASLGLYDVTGRLMWEKDRSPQSLNIPATSLPPGTYMLRVIDGETTESFNLEKR